MQPYKASEAQAAFRRQLDHHARNGWCGSEARVAGQGALYIAVEARAAFATLVGVEIADHVAADACTALWLRMPYNLAAGI